MSTDMGADSAGSAGVCQRLRAGATAVDQRLQFGADLPEAGGAQDRVFHQHAADQGGQAGREKLAKRGHVRIGIVDDGVDDGRRRVAAERQPAGQHLVQRDAERPHVGALIRLAAQAHLRADVQPGAERDAGMRQTRGGAGEGQSEIGQARRAVFGEQHIGRLDVAVDDVQVVGAGQRVGQFQGDGQRRLDRELRLPPEQIGQSATTYVLHDDDLAAVGLARSQDFDDVRMIEPVEQIDFPLKPRDRLRLARRQFGAETLDGHALAGLSVHAQIHFAHAATPD
ncbi:MAG: hypothetical protein IPK19_39425 [Chloroflexi bacterium]|nr:hypothetical protein [Chloroflexota bacterium]